MSAWVGVTLPGGLWLEGACHREAELRPVTGTEEAFLAEEGRALTPAERTTELLAGCLGRLGPLEPVPPDAVGALTVGDREALLLHLRRATFGERLQLVLACPGEGCGEPMDVELRVADLLVSADADPREVHEAMIEAEERTVVVRFRLPTGRDQEAAARLVDDVDSAAAELLAACVEDGSGGLQEEVAAALPALMAERDPQAEILLDLACPACGTAFAVLFDTGDFLERELAAEREGLFDEVHHLALAYHWREQEILALTTTRRRRYLALLGAWAGGVA